MRDARVLTCGNGKMKELRADMVIVGGGTGGTAAALALGSLGYKVIVTEPTAWIGGQLTSQAVPPDEHPWIESHGCTRRYRAYRDGVRKYYRDHFPLTVEARQNPRLNPGAGEVSRICHEPRVGHAVLEQMLAGFRSSGRVEVMLHQNPVAAEVEGDVVRSVTVQSSESGLRTVLNAPFFLDASELGDVLAQAGVEYVCGAESQSDTEEPHAVSGPAQPNNVQSISWCFPVAYDPEPGADHTIDKPAQYQRWRDYKPDLKPPWPGKLLDFALSSPHTLEPWKRNLFEGDWPLWRFRRIVTSQHYPESLRPHEVTLVNWPQIDYFEGNVIDQPSEQVQKYLDEAKQLSLSLLYWLQTEAPRPDGGQAYPGLYLRPDLVGTEDGLAMYPYIRESRRIRALFTVTENHVGVSARSGRSGPLSKSEIESLSSEYFSDSVGVGCYRIDLHPSTGGDNYIDISALPFQIPLGALIPLRVKNLLPACKNLGVTHITNGCYRLHPVEWNIGESAGLLAAFCSKRGVEPRAAREKQGLLGDFQSLLRGQGIELEWPKTRPV
jgi:hypothetical protein